MPILRVSQKLRTREGDRKIDYSGVTAVVHSGQTVVLEVVNRTSSAFTLGMNLQIISASRDLRGAHPFDFQARSFAVGE
jgi:hypothetical protein